AVMVRVGVKAGQVAETEELVGAVYEELAANRPEGLSYATFKLPDGVTFVHVARHATDNPLPKTAAFQRFQAGIRDRCEEPPVATALQGIGSYRAFGEEQ